mgnify:CR=1 FL=1
MINISNILGDLIQKTQNSTNQAILFAFSHNELSVRGIFFGASQTLTIGISGKNVAWQCDVSTGIISELIPNEAYTTISQSLKDSQGSYSNNQFFIKLIDELKKIDDPIPPTQQEIKNLLSNCKTSDKKYDKEGDKPFFDHWRRVKPSKNSLNKIQRQFGRDVSDSCCQHKVTAVWTDTFTRKSLDFLTPTKSIDEIQNIE